ncbi:phosphopantetheine-binding protein [Actinokineospora inagensis]|uniref:phosphopantetheine-binding protein n=1 Tax=Actinokineospora inagensis TaxID=103730 RepID=UPI000410565E|nr:phosphopantetheine-binding protein [Actinokineospora inagensis]
MSTDLVVDGMIRTFSRVLRSDDVTPDSDFFELGGDSLLATRVLSAVAREFGPELTIGDLLVAPTPSALAKLIEVELS